MSSATSDATVPMKQFGCPNGLLVWNGPDSGRETRFIYGEIFERRCYERQGVTVRDGDVVLDVGANVGLFALSLMERFRGLTIVCVEPVPSTRACLERNIAESPWRRHHDVTVLAGAIGATTGDSTISFFPRTPASSTMYPADRRHEWKTIVDEITFLQLWRRNKLLAVLRPLVLPWRRRAFARFVEPMFDGMVTLRVDVRTVSDVMRQHGLSRVDVLKIDVEGAELGVLEGIDEPHWPLVRQIAAEISPAHKSSLAAVADGLRARGFAHVVFESTPGVTSVLDDPMPCMLYAVRAPRGAALGLEQRGVRHDE